LVKIGRGRGGTAGTSTWTDTYFCALLRLKWRITLEIDRNIIETLSFILIEETAHLLRLIG
jgi:hypothetical protein